MTLLAALCSVGARSQNVAARFDMTLTDGGNITETVSQKQYPVSSELPAFTVDGISGTALRFDGYSNYVKAQISKDALSTEALTINIILSAETYPMMNTAEAETTPSYATVCGNLDETAKQGFALQLSSQGDIRFVFSSEYAKGYIFTINGNEKMACGRWNMVTVTLDKAANTAIMYLNGTSIGTCRMSRSNIVHSSADFCIGKDMADKTSGGYLINTFCGLIDDISIYNNVMTADQVAGLMPGNIAVVRPDFVYPESRYSEDLWRPKFHGMPSGGWTNECHGMAYSGGRWHLFFQKNANGPYMARLHWGHISSENLYKWHEEPIALRPGESYDIKGCWSGAVFTDNTVTGGERPGIIYTAVDNARAVIAMATATDDQLAGWTKSTHNPIIDGRPAGLSDDFRDPYFFSSGNDKYIIVGTSKDGIGACTLHKYQNGRWSNDGSTFFRGTNATVHGTFWEMPNVTDMGNGKWLFTCTPLNTGSGVRTLCWVGTISTDGTFTPDKALPEYLEMGGISKDGYGLLSPTIYRHDNKTILLGIVPDKLPSDVNRRMGWAHTYSLPREISLSAEGSLIQKPYSGLTAMRTAVMTEKAITLSGTESLAPVSGRQIELMGKFTVDKGSVGFNFLKNGSKKASLTYSTESGMLTLDLTQLDRQVNDGVYGGIYSVALPEKPKSGELLTLHVYVDGSIADIFVNERWAYSVRLFPTDATGVEAEAFATMPVKADIKAWTLDPEQNQAADIRNIRMYPASGHDSEIYNIKGQRLTHIPHNGIYVRNGKKLYAR